MSLRKRSLSLSGHATSVALEPAFWFVLERLAATQSMSLAGLFNSLDAGRGERSLASQARLAALAFALGEPSPDPEAAAG